MGWLQHTDDEVRRFHPAFRRAADAALADLGVSTQYTWKHHPPSLGSGTIPDFALVDVATNEWVLIVELKRTGAAVFSTRFQSQAKGYADVNQPRFRPGFPVYFAISNLEVTVLCALNGTRPPTECVVQGGIKRSGDFLSDTATRHERVFRADLASLVSRALGTRTETFDVVWPPIITDWIRYAEQLAAASPIGPPAPATPGWPDVNRYFGQPEPLAAARVTLLQALLAAYMRGRLIATSHTRAPTVPPLNSRTQVARALDALQAIDFEAIFDRGASSRFRTPTAAMRSTLDAYIAALAALRPDVATLARTRVDHEELLEQALCATYPPEARAGAGKVQTDPELAAVLAALTIDAPKPIIDPCCGDGPLLIAAFDRLTRLGHDRAYAVANVSGVESDPILSRLAGARLALRAGSAVGPHAQPVVDHGDMFTSGAALGAAGVVVMNPPFRRYEDQGPNPVPTAVLRHYANAIRAAAGNPPTTLEGQPNLFNYYVEYVTRTVAPGTRVGFILDNRWYHNRAGRPLRQLMLENYRILALVEYPHRFFFSGWDIATSLLIAERDSNPLAANSVRFVRTSADPRQADLDMLAQAMHNGRPWPPDWRVNVVPQGNLDAAIGWKRLFASALSFDLTQMGLTPLVDLFDRSRRGSLEKEGGGTHAFSMPFTRTRFGHRVAKSATGGFATTKVRPLTASENATLVGAATAIPASFRGRALKNSDNISEYELGQADVERDQTLEPPALRKDPSLFLTARRTKWTPTHRKALAEIRNNPATRAYLAAVERIVGLTSTVLPDERRFVDLREPYAGELIIPRKMRTGHRVHVNPFAFKPSSRQVRISSNFVTYGSCTAVDPAKGVGRGEATALIAAFLVSAFGQLQFEENGVNREGLLALEKSDMDKVLVPQPASIAPARRQRIAQEFARLPFPVRVDMASALQPRRAIDRLFAEELAPRVGATVDALLLAVHDAVDEWITARQP